MRIKRWQVVAVLLVVAVVIAYGWLTTSRPQAVAPPAAGSSPIVADTVTNRIGPPEIYPRADLNPGLANPDITQDNIADTICNQNWKTSSVRPPASSPTPP